MLAWSLGLFLLDWFQIPTALFGAREPFAYTQFDPLFAISIPLSFLGFLFVYLGIQTVTHAPVKKIAYTWFFLWFLAALVFYGLQYWGTEAVESRFGILTSEAFFLVPVQVLNLSALWAAYHDKSWLTTALARWGLVALMGSVLVSLARYAFYVEKVILYPPLFALLLIRSLTFYLTTQMLGIVLLVVGFLMIHKEIVRGKTQGMEGTFQKQ
ncbi:MAG: hypothetical protein M1398_08525 [Deltaproteobacteria bacterium]|nr:hypothetical protein [Deltaproteobacteria bacterium]